MINILFFSFFLVQQSRCYHTSTLIFPNLVHFELIIEVYQFDVLAEILQITPKLEVLVILKVCYFFFCFFALVFLLTNIYIYVCMCFQDKKTKSISYSMNEMKGHIFRGTIVQGLHLLLENAVWMNLKGRSVSFNLLDLLWRMQVICVPLKSLVHLRQILMLRFK